MKKDTIHFVSAPCGAGKTYAAAKYIKRHIAEQNFLVVCPTLKLASQTEATLRDINVPARLITSETSDARVKSEIIAHINKMAPQGNVLVITWSAYVDLPYRAPHKNILVIIDEVPQLDTAFCFDISHHTEEIERFIDIEPVNDQIARVVARDMDGLKRRLSQRSDQIDELFSDFLRQVYSPYRTMYVDQISFERVFDLRQISKDRHTSNQVHFVSMLNSSLFEGAVLLGANIEESMLYHWLERYHQLTFKPHLEIQRALRNVQTVGQRATIYYFLNGERTASKDAYGQTYLGKSIIEEMDILTAQLFGNDAFLYSTNKGRRTSLATLTNATRIEVDTKGLNSYQHFHNLYFSPALQRNPKQYKMLKALGLPSDLVQRSTACEQAYQASMRTSLRNPIASEPVKLVLPDKVTADYVAKAIGCEQVINVPLPWQPKSRSPQPASLTRAQIKSRSKAKKATNSLYASKRVPASLVYDGSTLDEAQLESCETSPLERGRLATRACFDEFETCLESIEEGNLPTCYVTIHRTLYDTAEDDHAVWKGSAIDLVRFLKTQAGNVVSDKEECDLINPATFQRSDDTSGLRTKSNFKSAPMLVLDFDNGNLAPEDFISIFYTDAGRGRKRSFVICNSYSRSPEQPNRFRVFLFFKRPAESIEQMQAVYNGVLGRLEEHGFSRLDAKLDNCSGVQSFYLPCTNRHHSQMAFFESYGMTSRELNRTIDPSEFGKTCVTADTRIAKCGRSAVGAGSLAFIDAAVAPLVGKTQDRHASIMSAAAKLARHGLTEPDIAAALREVLGNDRKMRKKIHDCLKSLRSYGQL